MKCVLVGIVLSLSTLTFAQQQKPMTLKAVLLEQLRSTHNKESGSSRRTPQSQA